MRSYGSKEPFLQIVIPTNGEGSCIRFRYLFPTSSTP